MVILVFSKLIVSLNNQSHLNPYYNGFLIREKMKVCEITLNASLDIRWYVHTQVFDQIPISPS